MVIKVKEKFEKTRHVKNNDKSKKYILRGQRNVSYHDIILSNTKKSYKFSEKDQFHFQLFELEDLIELEHLPEQLVGLLFGGGEYIGLKYCRLLLLLWRGKNDDEFFIMQLKKVVVKLAVKFGCEIGASRAAGVICFLIYYLGDVS